MLIENFGGTNNQRKILGRLKIKLKIFIETKNIFIPLKLSTFKILT
jgi:hypothetical protein